MEAVQSKVPAADPLSPADVMDRDTDLSGKQLNPSIVFAFCGLCDIGKINSINQDERLLFRCCFQEFQKAAAVVGIVMGQEDAVKAANSLAVQKWKQGVFGKFLFR